MKITNSESVEETSKIMVFLKKNGFIILLLLFALLMRISWPLTNSFAFQFDHGKDALAVMDLILNHNLKFVGPWTSIPGLYFGCAWYYILAVFYGVGNFAPQAAIWGMIFLILIQVFLMNKYFGKLAALTIATGHLWMTISASAWNPFPLTLVSLLMLIIFKINYLRPEAKRFIELQEALGLGVLIGLGFHFSSAYAFFYFLIIPVVIYLLKIKFDWKIFLIFGAGILIPFLPQVMFEFKNDFVETKAIYSYFAGGGENGDKLTGQKITYVLHASWGEIRTAFAPAIAVGSPKINDLLLSIMVFFWLAASCFCLVKNVVLKEKEISTISMWQVYLAFIIIPIIGFIFLHFNIWYLLGMMPAAVILFSGMIVQWPKVFLYIWISLLVLAPISRNIVFWQIEKDSFFASESQFIKPKIWAVNKIKEVAADRDYAVYIYQSDIYDFAYQYLFFADAKRTQTKLPVEFAYKPQAPVYIKEKPALNNYFAYSPTPENAEIVFYLIEGEPKDGYYLEWLSAQTYPNREDWQLVDKIEGKLYLYQVIK